MPTRRRERFIYGQAAWALTSLFVLALLDAVTLELVFVVSLIGFLVVTELTAPFAITPRWRRRLRWVIAVGLVVFAIIVVRRILAILPPGVLTILPSDVLTVLPVLPPGVLIVLPPGVVS